MDEEQGVGVLIPPSPQGGGVSDPPLLLSSPPPRSKENPWPFHPLPALPDHRFSPSAHSMAAKAAVKRVRELIDKKEFGEALTCAAAALEVPSPL